MGKYGPDKTPCLDTFHVVYTFFSWKIQASTHQISQVFLA